jgi:hypothetical protein
MDAQPTDQEILDHYRKVKDEHMGNSPLVGTLMDFSSIKEEYKNAEGVYPWKINHLASICKEKGIRAIKKDGNCNHLRSQARFLPGFCFSILRNDEERKEREGCLAW